MPDGWSQDIVHTFKNGIYDDGIWLVPKNIKLSENEINHRFVASKKALDIIASNPIPFPIYTIDSYDEYESALNECDSEMFYMDSRNIETKNMKDFYFPYHDRYNRSENHVFRHMVKDEVYYNGLFLLSKNKKLTKNEVEYRHLVSRKEWDKIGSTSIVYDKFEIETYDEYLRALDESNTELFWAITPNIDIHKDFFYDMYFTHDDEYNRKENHVFAHKVNDKIYYNGLFLLSKHKPVTKNEIEYRHIVSRKEWRTVVSGPVQYESFIIDTYEQYEIAKQIAKTELIYAIPSNVIVTHPLNLYFTHDDEYSRKENHTLQNLCNGELKQNGIFLLSKHKSISKKELEHRHLVHKNIIDIQASKHKPYDVVFISYNEAQADENYELLLKKVPYAKRVHGVKGIHEAHIQAAKQCESEMIWIVDADALIVDGFDFDLFVEKWDRETVHVWRSKNPINNLVYGYGGVKLFPRLLTINMDKTKPDMTTSITNKFIAVPKISNITAFNVDEFSTWKSAFRECCKLASKIIDRQKDIETEQRLDIWCTVGDDKPFGEYAVAGAKAGREYGYKNKDNVEALKKINDFDWLKELYDKYN
jgi:CYTH domain-containing protein